MSKGGSMAAEINRLHGAFYDGLRTTLGIAVQIGELLVAQKKECGHGKWEVWVAANLEFSAVTAWKYMRCFYRQEELSNLKATKDFSIEAIAKVSAEPCEEELKEAASDKPTPPKRELVFVPGQERPVLLGGRPLPVMNGRIRTDNPKTFDIPNRRQVESHLASACEFARRAGMSGDELLERLRALVLECKLN